MTGWRLGWVVAPAAVIPDLAKLLEYNTSCAPTFVQRAGIVAVTTGDDVIAHTLARYRRARVDGVADSLAFCKRLVAEAGLGLAPGIAFGPEGEGFVRWCFASSEPRLADGVTRLQQFLSRA